MKKIIISALLISTTFISSGHCSYLHDYQYSNLSIISDDTLQVAKCFMIIDMIENTKNKEEKKRLKTVLKIELNLLKEFLRDIEEYEKKPELYTIDLKNKHHNAINQINELLNKYQ